MALTNTFPHSGTYPGTYCFENPMFFALRALRALFPMTFQLEVKERGVLCIQKL
jgi:hypothetical protein